MAKFFQDILKQGASANIGRPNTKTAIEWYRNAAKNITSANPTSVMSGAGAFQRMETLSMNSIGRMYMFQYDAKYKNDDKVLPYWDMFPLVFPIEIYATGDSPGFLGINMHYLDPRLRAMLMDSLWEEEAINKDKLNKTTKLNITYAKLKGASQHALFKPCVKRYLSNHVKSLFMNVSPEEWNIALMLPMQRFQKKSDQYVWAQSAEKAGV